MACLWACIIPATGLPWTLPLANPTRHHAFWHTHQQLTGMMQQMTIPPNSIHLGALISSSLG